MRLPMFWGCRMRDLPELGADPLCLSPLRPADVTDTYVSWLHDPETSRFTEVGRRSHTIESVKSYVSDAVAAGDAAMWRIEVDGDHIGNIRLSSIDRWHKKCDVAILIGNRNLHGQGIGPGAIGLAAAYAFENLDIEKLSAGMYAANHPSIRCFVKAGFAEDAVLSRHVIFEGQRMDVVRMSRFRDDQNA